jgi:DNA primase
VTRYTADSRDRVFDAVDMIALISERTELRRAGVNSYFGICPFHDERTGSFHVSPEEKLYHCFGCQVSGNPFDFVMETRGLDFKGALEALADRFGVKLETEAEDPAAATRRERRERLEKLLGRAATYYSRYLWEAREAQDARSYLLGRGLEEQTLRAFRVGYAPSAWDRILTASRKAGYSDEELLAVGLAQRSKTRPGQIYDRFRERIMFPAVDARGRVHGFGARRMRENQGGAKYLNTSDGELYHKREVLFGIDLARAPAASSGRMILVEGYTDVLALQQAGLQNAVGIMGTALTEEQVRELENADASAFSSCASTPIEPGRRRCSAPHGWRPRASSSCASCRCPTAPTPPSWCSATGLKRCASACRARSRSRSSTSTGSSSAATRAAPRARTGRWPSWRRCSTSWRPACCATS